MDGWRVCILMTGNAYWAAWQTSIQTGVPYEVEHAPARRHQRSLSLVSCPRRAAAEMHRARSCNWFGTCTDIDEQKRAEQKLKESEENLRVLAETVPQLVWTTRPDGRIEYTNQRWCDYTGLTLEHMQGTMGWRPVHPS